MLQVERTCEFRVGLVICPLHGRPIFLDIGQQKMIYPRDMSKRSFNLRFPLFFRLRNSIEPFILFLKKLNRFGASHLGVEWRISRVRPLTP